MSDLQLAKNICFKIKLKYISYTNIKTLYVHVIALAIVTYPFIGILRVSIATSAQFTLVFTVIPGDKVVGISTTACVYEGPTLLGLSIKIPARLLAGAVTCSIRMITQVYF